MNELTRNELKELRLEKSKLETQIKINEKYHIIH